MGDRRRLLIGVSGVGAVALAVLAVISLSSPGGSPERLATVGSSVAEAVKPLVGARHTDDVTRVDVSLGASVRSRRIDRGTDDFVVRVLDGSSGDAVAEADVWVCPGGRAQGVRSGITRGVQPVAYAMEGGEIVQSDAHGLVRLRSEDSWGLAAAVVDGADGVRRVGWVEYGKGQADADGVFLLPVFPQRELRVTVLDSRGAAVPGMRVMVTLCTVSDQMRGGVLDSVPEQRLREMLVRTLPADENDRLGGTAVVEYGSMFRSCAQRVPAEDIGLAIWLTDVVDAAGNVPRSIVQRLEPGVTEVTLRTPELTDAVCCLTAHGQIVDVDVPVYVRVEGRRSVKRPQRIEVASEGPLRSMPGLVRGQSYELFAGAYPYEERYMIAEARFVAGEQPRVELAMLPGVSAIRFRPVDVEGRPLDLQLPAGDSDRDGQAGVRVSVFGTYHNLCWLVRAGDGLVLLANDWARSYGSPPPALPMVWRGADASRARAALPVSGWQPGYRDFGDLVFEVEPPLVRGWVVPAGGCGYDLWLETQRTNGEWERYHEAALAWHDGFVFHGPPPPGPIRLVVETQDCQKEHEPIPVEPGDTGIVIELEPISGHDLYVDIKVPDRPAHESGYGSLSARFVEIEALTLEETVGSPWRPRRGAVRNREPGVDRIHFGGLAAGTYRLVTARAVGGGRVVRDGIRVDDATDGAVVQVDLRDFATVVRARGYGPGGDVLEASRFESWGVCDSGLHWRFWTDIARPANRSASVLEQLFAVDPSVTHVIGASQEYGTVIVPVKGVGEVGAEFHFREPPRAVVRFPDLPVPHEGFRWIAGLEFHDSLADALAGRIPDRSVAQLRSEAQRTTVEVAGYRMASVWGTGDPGTEGSLPIRMPGRYRVLLELERVLRDGFGQVRSQGQRVPVVCEPATVMFFAGETPTLDLHVDRKRLARALEMYR